MIKKVLSVILSLTIVAGSVSLFGGNDVKADVSLNDVAYGKSVTCSSALEGYDGGYAVDGNSATEWRSATTGFQWITVDLGATYYVGSISMNFGEGYPADYTVAWAGATGEFQDAVYWHGGSSGINVQRMFNRPIRYIRVSFNQMANENGIIMKDFTVQGSLAPVQTPPVMSVIGKTNINVAYGKTVTATALAAQNYNPENIVDNNSNTKWASGAVDTAEVTIDLHNYYVINMCAINWGDNYSKNFTVQYSIDGTNWSNYRTGSASANGTSLINFENRYIAKYIKIIMNEPSGDNGFEIKDVSLYGYK